MTLVLIGIAMVFVIEGLVLALAPDFYETAARMMRDTPRESRRMAGLVAVAFGVGLLWMLGV